MRKQQYFTTSGMNHRHGIDSLEKRDEVHMLKKPRNEYGSKAGLTAPP